MPPAVRDRATTVPALLSSFDALLALCDSLSPRDWTTASLCPDWDLAGVLRHVASVEAMLDGWFPASADDPLPFGVVLDWSAATDGLDPAALLDRSRATIDARRPQLAALTDEQFDAPSPTPIGKKTYGAFMRIRTFDVWTHHRDIAVPMGIATDDGGDAAEIAVDEVHGSLGYIVGKRIGLPDGMSIRFRLTGPVERDLCAKVDERAQTVDELDDPTVEVVTDSSTFMLLACGRIDPQGPIDDGRITWSGDATYGEAAARNLRFTI